MPIKRWQLTIMSILNLMAFRDLGVNKDFTIPLLQCTFLCYDKWRWNVFLLIADYVFPLWSLSPRCFVVCIQIGRTLSGAFLKLLALTDLYYCSLFDILMKTLSKVVDRTFTVCKIVRSFYILNWFIQGSLEFYQTAAHCITFYQSWQ